MLPDSRTHCAVTLMAFIIFSVSTISDSRLCAYSADLLATTTAPLASSFARTPGVDQRLLQRVGDALQLLQPAGNGLGGGFKVTRLLPATKRRSFGPFVFFDFGPATEQPGNAHDVGLMLHPTHR